MLRDICNIDASDNKAISKLRLNYLDIAKGIGIILMIIGHIAAEYEYIRKFILCFHMPLFFIISGYFFRHRENKECLKYIFKRLIIPYIIMSILIILYKVVRLAMNESYSEILSTIKTLSMASLYGSGSIEAFNISNIGPMWFLLALAFAIYFMNNIYNTKYKPLWVLLIAYIGYKTSEYIWLPFSIQAGMVSLIFIYIGMVAKKYDIFNKRINLNTYIFCTLIFAFCVKYGGDLLMVQNLYKNGFLDIIGAVCGTFLCIKLSQFIDRNLKISSKMFIFFGKNSLICLCLHLFALKCLSFTFVHNILKYIGIQNYVLRSTLINIVWVVVVLAIIKIFSIIKIKFTKI